MRTVTVEQRRRLVVRRHHLAGDADGTRTVVRAMVALHATDPASVYLAVLARSRETTLGDIRVDLYDDGGLVRWLAMRRTLFVLARDDVPMVQAAVSTPLARTLRRRLENRMLRQGTEPRAGADPGSFLRELEHQVERALRERDGATGAQLASEIPGLRTKIRARRPSDVPEGLTTALLTLLGAEGRIVRGRPTGAWTNRQHRWELPDRWWSAGVPEIDPERARHDLARRWLERFGPATVDDLRWWTGWTKTTTARALTELPLTEVDLHGQTGIALDEVGLTEDSSQADGDAPSGVATLLPALDPTPMGWRHRDWMLGVDRGAIYDRAGNIGPTVWWDGEVVGSWAVTRTADIRVEVLADRGSFARAQIDVAAANLRPRLQGTVVTPSARTPHERELSRQDHPGV